MLVSRLELRLKWIQVLMFPFWDLHDIHVKAVAFSPDGKFIASVCSYDIIRVWDAFEPTSPSKILCEYNESVRTIQFSSDSTLLACDMRNGTIDFWHLVTETRLALTLKKSIVENVRFFLDTSHPVPTQSQSHGDRSWNPSPLRISWKLTSRFFVEENWIHSWKDNDQTQLLIWLPPEFRPTSQAS